MSSIDLVKVAKFELYPSKNPTDYAIGFNITVVGGENIYTETRVPLTSIEGMSSDEIAEQAWLALRPKTVEKADKLVNFAGIVGRIIEQREAEQYFPWIQPGGAHDAYAKGAKASHESYIWVSNLDGNVWEPSAYGWSIIAIADDEQATPLDEDATPEDATPNNEPDAWVAPEGAHDAYQTGDRVTHLDSVWVSAINDNVWEPGVYGWELE